jgi:hypothetical protein
MFAKRQPETKGQPDASRLEAARAFARRVAAVPAEEFAIA